MPKDDIKNPENISTPEKAPESEGSKKIDKGDELAEIGDKVEYEAVKEEEPSEERRPQESHRDHGEEDKGLKHKLKKKDAEVKALKKEKEEFKDKYLRKLAEMENLRKRLEREKSEYQQYALSDFLRELLVVLDNFERALRSRDQADGKSFQEGVEMIFRQYQDMLKKKGVEPLEIRDKKFDPMFHQAVLTEEAEAVSEPEIAEELQRGYLLHGRLLRPALVKVLVPKKREGQ